MLQSLLEAKTSPPLLYQGTGLIADSDNPLILCLLSASTSAYTYNPDQLIKEYPHGVGKNNILLIAALQARNNARVLFSGSIFIFSDEAFTSPTQKGQAAYTIMDDVVYSIDVEQLSGGKWVPYETNNLQLEIGICYKPKPILDILLRNQKLIEFLTRFHTDRSEDEQFNDEKTYLIKQIKELKSVHDN